MRIDELPSEPIVSGCWSSLMMTRKDLTDESFEMPEGTSFTQVKKISMMENGIKSMSCISRYFPNIEFLVLSKCA